MKTRTENKHKRRDFILARAGDIIAKDGLDALTIARLAKQSNVTIPTVHNLLGRRADILDTLVREAMTDVMRAATAFDPSDTIPALEDFIDGLIGLIATNEPYYRAFIAGERINFFEHQSPDGIAANSRNYAREICAHALKQGKLLGEIDEKQIAQRLFSSQSVCLIALMHGYIDLKPIASRFYRHVHNPLCRCTSADFNRHYCGGLKRFLERLVHLRHSVEQLINCVRFYRIALSLGRESAPYANHGTNRLPLSPASKIYLSGRQRSA